MALKRTLDTGPSSGSKTIESSLKNEEVPTLKLRVKDVQVSAIQHAITDIAHASKKTEKLNALLNVSNVSISELRIDEANEVLRVLMDLLRKESDANVKGKILSIVAELFKIPSFHQIHALDEFLELASEEGKIAKIQVV